MASTTRYYFGPTTGPTGTALGPDWDSTAPGTPGPPAARRLWVNATSEGGSGGQTAASEAGKRRTRVGAFVSPPLAATTLAGRVRFVQGGRSDAGGEARVALVVRVVSGDGSVSRGYLLPFTATPTALPPTGAGNGTMSTVTIDAALTPLAVQAGDRLLVETGILRTADTQAVVRESYESWSADLPFAEVPFSDPQFEGLGIFRRPWVEFAFTDPPPDPPTGLAQIAGALDSVTVGWVPPAAGAAPTSYEVRVGAGAWVDVGLVTTHTVAGLSPGTTVAVEVRTIAATGPSTPAGPVDASTADALEWVQRPFVSHTLLATAGLDVEADQPAFQWHDYAAGWALDDLRSRALMGWTITTGRPGPRDRVAPAVVTVTLAAWGEYAAAGLPQLGQRFRLTLSPLLTALGLASADLPRFTGEVTDVDLDPHTRVLTVTGVGRYARQGRQPVDGTGWPVEREGARVARILAAIGAEAGTLDAGRLDLAAPATAGVGAQLVDTVSDSTTGQLVEQRDGRLDWHDADHRRDAPTVLTLDAGELLRGFRWSQRVGDLTNAVTVRYAGGEVHVEDTASVTARGAYPASLDTLLTRPAAAQAVGGLIVGRYGDPVWLLPAVLVDLLRTLDPAELPAGVGLAHGDKVQLSGLPAGGPYAERGAYVEGVTETLTPRAWRLTVTVADEQLAGAPMRWRDVPNGVRWTDVTDGLRWLDVATIQDPADLT